MFLQWDVKKERVTASPLLLGLLLLDLDDGGPLLGDALGTAGTGGLVLRTAGFHLVGEVLGSGLLSLGL